VIRLALAALVAALVVAQPATPYSAAGTPWPVTRITVWNETPYRAPLAQAMAAWNGVGTRVTLVPAPQRSAARVVVTLLPPGAAGDDVAQATLGWTPTAQGKVEVRPGLGARVAAAVLAHELGHVLGLGHEERGCSVMAGTVAVERSRAGCRIAQCPKVEACLVTRDDAEGLRDLYERRLPALRPRSVEAASVRVVRSAGSFLELAWTSPLAGPGAAVLVRAERGRCPATPYRTPLARTGSLPLERGARQSAALPLPGPGAWCAGLWVQESSSLLTGPPVYVRVAVP
jgi:hypothetical protein